MYNFTDYHNLHTGDLVSRLSSVVTELANLLVEIADVEAGEVRERAAAMRGSQNQTSSGRRDSATMNVVEPTATRIELSAQKDALQEEKWLIVRILEARHNI